MTETETEVYATLHKGKKEWRINMKQRGPGNPFRTGSIGFTGQDNIVIDGKMHLCSINVVEHGTKGKYHARPSESGRPPLR